jgi:hypothetical protein
MLDDVPRFHRERRRVVARCANGPTDVKRAMSLNGRIYERLYRTHWAVPPDLFVIAESDDVVVATAGLIFAGGHPDIPSEAYFDYGAAVARFFADERPRIAEIGRLTSTNTAALKAVIDTAVQECWRREILYMVGWTSPPVRAHLAEHCGIHFQHLDARLNVDRALQDKNWVTTPTGFFVRDDAPQLLMTVLAVHQATFLQGRPVEPASESAFLSRQRESVA